MARDEGAKARGAYFTPVALCEFMAAWALGGAGTSVLEPSCGDGEFLSAVASRARSRGRAVEITGVDIHAKSVAVAKERVRNAAGGKVETKVVTADFLGFEPGRLFDVVIGNPPYVRFQDLGELGRRRAKAAAREAGVELNALASLWAAFVVRAGSMLAPGGRLALVLPGELLSAGYAGPVREYLLGHFGCVDLVLVATQTFPGASTESVLVLASEAGVGPASGVRVSRVSSSASLRGLSVIDGELLSVAGGERWSEALVEDAGAVKKIGADIGAVRLGAWGSVNLGSVTGANSFFVLTETRARELGILSSCVDVISARALRGLGTVLSEARLTAVGRSEVATKLFYPSGDMSVASAAYIKFGEGEGVNAGYKCRIRDPWWRVPLVESAHVLVTYMNAGGVRLVANATKASHLNSLHGLYLPRGRRGLARALAVAAASGLSLASAELVGRSYGGGVLKVEPGEAANILVAPAGLVQSKAKELIALEKEVAAAQAGGDPFMAAESVDNVLWESARGGELALVRAVGRAAALRRRQRGEGV